MKANNKKLLDQQIVNKILITLTPPPPNLTTFSFSQGFVISFSGTPTITTKKLNWKNYRAWLDSIELWFLGQGFHDHLEKQEAEIPKENKSPWLKLDYQLCAILWQFVTPELLDILRSFKTCYSF
ncbi:hypothetical protein CR513_32102, partial [Mucuna pruriens]